MIRYLQAEIEKDVEYHAEKHKVSRTEARAAVLNVSLTHLLKGIGINITEWVVTEYKHNTKNTLTLKCEQFLYWKNVEFYFQLQAMREDCEIIVFGNDSEFDLTDFFFIDKEEVLKHIKEVQG